MNQQSRIAMALDGEEVAGVLQPNEAHESPDLPRMVQAGGVWVPQGPRDLAATGVDPVLLADLTLKTGYTVSQFTTDWAARRLHLPLHLTQELLEGLRQERLLEVLGQVGPFSTRYTITQRGRERAAQLFEVSGYVGPAPVSLASYEAMLDWQLAHFAPIEMEDVKAALAELVFSEETIRLAGLAVSSGRSLFLFGPPGNGKSSLGRLLHRAMHGHLWIPHTLVVDTGMIRVFDNQCHQRVDPSTVGGTPDLRWVRIGRPFIVVGGELTLDFFDLNYSPSLRYYEAPIHFKANGGLFLIDDFGRERIDPKQLINRWITPLEYQIDHLALHMGQKFQVPIRLMLMMATNLQAEAVADAAFLRRLGYRLYLGRPTPEQYARIFQEYAARLGVTPSPKMINLLLQRYGLEGRELRACEPRDLLERARDICRFRQQSLALDEETLDLAWKGYFGTTT
jgi:MoxR-like ATPase